MSNDTSRLIVSRAEFEELKESVRLQSLHLAHLDKIFHQWRDDILAEIRGLKSSDRTLQSHLEIAENALKVIRKAQAAEKEQEGTIQRWETGPLRSKYKLLQEIDSRFSRADLPIMALATGLDYDSIQGETKQKDIFNLIEACENHEYMGDLLNYLIEKRPSKKNVWQKLIGGIRPN